MANAATVTLTPAAVDALRRGLAAARESAADPLKTELAQLLAMLDRADVVEAPPVAAWQAIADAVEASVTAAMVERLTATATQAVEALVPLTTPEGRELLAALADNAQPLAQVIRRVGQWERDGMMERLDELMVVLQAFRDSFSPLMAERLVSFGSERVAQLFEALTVGVVDLGTRMAYAGREAVQEAAARPEKMGVSGLLRALKDPAVQEGVKVTLGLLRRLPEVMRPPAEARLSGTAPPS